MNQSKGQFFKKITLLSVLLAVAACATSPQRAIQSETSKDFSPAQGFPEVDQLIQVGDYVNALKKMEFMKGSISDPQILARWLEKRGTVFSFVGRYQQALQDFDQFTKLINPNGVRISGALCALGLSIDSYRLG